MELIRAKIIFAFFAACALIFAFASCATADDRSVLLEIAPLSNYSLAGWHPNNTASVCTWDRVVCDSDGRVIELHLESDYDLPVNLLSGSLPQSIAQLDRLQHLDIGNNPIYGDFPPSVFSLPNLRAIYMINTGLTISFPANLSNSIASVIASYSKVVSPIPDANWDQMSNFGLESTGIKCPLPPGLVAYFNAGKNLTECTLNMNNLFIDKNNLVCGQIHSSKLTCRISTSSHKAPYFATDDTTQPTRFVAHLGNFTIEFTEDEAMIFATYDTRRGVRKEYRREYLSFRLQPISETYGGALERMYATLNRPFWDSFIVEGNRVRANSTVENSLIQEYIFELANDQDPPFVKVSNAGYNLGHRWISDPRRVTTVSVFLIFSFRISHSPTQGPALTCYKGNTGGSSCSSSVANLNSFYDFASGNSILIARTKTVEFRYAYSLIGTLDGVPLYSNTSSIIAHRLPVPLPSSRWLEANRRAGFIVQSNNMTDAEQSFCIPVELFMPPFQKKFYFDPDVSITLLFDPNDNVAPEETDPGVQAAGSVGLIVGLIVVGVVVLASITLFATVIFPYLKRRNAKHNGVELEEAAGSSPTGNVEDESAKNAGWVKSSTPST
eukprot:TRINITY_DN12135_c0_g1_i1.p1 TRINITY_DN12135_c0_g1~~TRINITY_DN12135_c0_g1_i1.p1  ORF type:complete len:611 (-),score=83.87 TRINITY_DN12135_c0_g1_i1:285-2117(-)